METLLDREKTRQLISSLNLRLESSGEIVKMPRGEVLNVTEAKNPSKSAHPLLVSSGIIKRIGYPLICKPLAACGTVSSHEMLIIHSPGSFSVPHSTSHSTSHSLTSNANPNDSICLNGAVGSKKEEDCSYCHDEGEVLFKPGQWLIQSLVDHGDCVYKVYVMGEKCFVDVRPSVSSKKCSHRFNSQKMPKIFGIEDEKGNGMRERALENVKEADLANLAKQLRAHIGLTLFGFDLIVDVSTGRHYIVDVNYFPSYKHMPNMPKELALLLRSKQEAFKRRKKRSRIV